MIRMRALLVVVVTASGCVELTKPRDTERFTLRVAAANPEVNVRPVPPPPTDAATAPQPASAEKIRVAHILIGYKGALNARPAVARTKEDAGLLASRVRNRAKFEAFADLAKTYSEDLTTKTTGGDLGMLSKEELADLGAAAFDLKPGGLDVVETDFGFHIIKRAL